MVDVSSVAQTLISGIMMGALYSLMAFGLQIVYGVMRIINVAHAVLMVFSIYLTYFLFETYSIDPFLSIAITLPFMFLIGWGIQRFIVNRVVTAPMVTSLLLMFGVGQVIESLIAYYWTSNFKSVTPSYGATSILLAGLSFPIVRVLGFVVSIVLLILLDVLIVKTKTGKAIRATAQDREAAQAMGIDINRVFLISFSIAIATVAPAGAVTAMIYAFYPTLHYMFTPKLFCICVLGGLGSIRGVFAGAMILGIVEAMTGAFLTLEWAPVVAYGLLITILVVRPRGLFGKA